MQDLAHPISKKTAPPTSYPQSKWSLPSMDGESGSFAKGIAMQQLDMKMQGWEES